MRKKWFYCLALAIAVLIIVVAVRSRSEPAGAQFKIAETSATTAASAEPAKMVQYPGFPDEIKLQKGQLMLLTNPNEDTYYLQYTITDNGGKEIYKSDLVPPATTADHAASFTGSDVFAKGENTVTVTVNAYKGADFTPCQAATQQRIKVSVE